MNKHCSSLSAKRLLKIQTEFQIPHNVATRLEKSVTPMMARVLDFMRFLLQVGGGSH